MNNVLSCLETVEKIAKWPLNECIINNHLVLFLLQEDMALIKKEYETAYGEPLAKAIKGDGGGDLEKVLLALIGEE